MRYKSDNLHARSVEPRTALPERLPPPTREMLSGVDQRAAYLLRRRIPTGVPTTRIVVSMDSSVDPERLDAVLRRLRDAGLMAEVGPA